MGWAGGLSKAQCKSPSNTVVRARPRFFQFDDPFRQIYRESFADNARHPSWAAHAVSPCLWNLTSQFLLSKTPKYTPCRSKPAGFRDVRRLEVSEGQPDLSLKAATHNLQEDGEWRIISDSSPSMRDLSLKIDERFLIKQTNAENDEGVTSRTVVPIEPLVPIWQVLLEPL
jgi:hypothetical protein